jgi:hypothetical protein
LEIVGRGGRESKASDVIGGGYPLPPVFHKC